MTEQISALIDGALDSEELVQVLQTMYSNKQATEAWHYYHLIGDAMRDTGTLSAGFKQDLMQQLELEPTVLAPNAVQSKVEKSDHGKTAIPMPWSIAASVAAITVVAWMALQVQTQPLENVAPIAKVTNPNTNMVALANTKPAKAPEIPAEYLVAHQAFAPSASSYYVQAVSYAE
ncbi:MAG: sigma-E factor negative regulatory protein [Methylotenera sp.]|nr:sigma-E factor negative regulatory protein [Methylotenera sp.]